jgi:hypothetical protein
MNMLEDDDIRSALRSLAPSADLNTGMLGIQAQLDRVRRRRLAAAAAAAAVVVAIAFGASRFGADDIDILPEKPSTSTTAPTLRAGEQIVALASIKGTDAWVATSRRVLFTSDAGVSWSLVGTLPSDATMVRAAFASDHAGVVAWVSADDGAVRFASIARTEMGTVRTLGQARDGSLELRRQAASYTLVSSSICDELQCVATLYRSSDGVAWVTSITDRAIEGVQCIGDGTCWAGSHRLDTDGREAVIVRSLDNGERWDEIDLPIPDASIDLGNTASVVYARGDDFIVRVDRPTGNLYGVTLLVSDDGGRTFSTLDVTATDELSAPWGTGAPFLVAVHSLRAWTAALDDGIEHTNDGGITWESHPAPGAIQNMFWFDATSGWIAVVTPSGSPSLWRTVDGGVSWVDVVLPAMP